MKCFFCLMLFGFLGFFQGCALFFESKPSTTWGRFLSSASDVNPLQIQDSRWIFSNDEALKEWADLMKNADSDSKIYIRQFYMRSGPSFSILKSALEGALARGVPVEMQVDDLFAKPVFHQLQDLKKHPSFQMQVREAPSEEMKEFFRERYGVSDLEGLVEAVSSGDSNALAALVPGVEPLGEANLPTEVGLTRLFSFLAEKSSFVDKFKLKSHLESYSHRFHDKQLEIRGVHGSVINLGGRGWTDAFLKDKNSDLTYHDLDISFRVRYLNSEGAANGVLFSPTSSDDKNLKSYLKNHLSLIRSARERLVIFTAYFAPPYEIISELKSATRRGVHVEVYTNSLESSDFPWAQALMYENMKAWRQELGFRFSLFILTANEGRTFHAKLAVADGNVVMISNGNWDYRSFFYDSNSFVVFQSDGKNQWASAWLKPGAFKWHQWSDSDDQAVDQSLENFFGPDLLRRFRPLLKDSFVKALL